MFVDQAREILIGGIERGRCGLGRGLDEGIEPVVSGGARDRW
jgi:hypothetical protein